MINKIGVMLISFLVCRNLFRDGIFILSSAVRKGKKLFLQILMWHPDCSEKHQLS